MEPPDFIDLPIDLNDMVVCRREDRIRNGSLQLVRIGHLQ